MLKVSGFILHSKEDSKQAYCMVCSKFLTEAELAAANKHEKEHMAEFKNKGVTYRPCHDCAMAIETGCKKFHIVLHPKDKTGA
jgi:hypothetical protein